MSQERENTQATRKDEASMGLPLLSPFGLMRRLLDDLDRIGMPGASVWMPPLEVVERDGKLVVRVEVPGLDKDQVKVEVVDNQLIISGERNRQDEERREGFYRSECSYGRFCRTVALPDGIDPDQVMASFNNGVLEVAMAAPRRSRAKRIEIRPLYRRRSKRRRLRHNLKPLRRKPMRRPGADPREEMSCP
jgi:HSP20 family protein